MVQFFNDTCTEAGTTPVELQSHTSDSGHTWTADTAVRIDAVGDYIQGTAAGNARLFPYASVTPPSADYRVSMGVTVLNTDNFTIVGPMARMQGASTNSGYAFCVDPNEQTVALYRYDNGSEVQIGVPFSVDLSAPPVTLGLGIEVSGTTIKGFLDDIERDEVTGEATYTSAGAVGFIRRMNTANSDFEIDNISADTLGSTQSVSTSDTGRPGQQVTISTSGFTSGIDTASWSDGTNSISLTVVNQTTLEFPGLSNNADYAAFGSGTLTVSNSGNAETADTSMTFSQTSGWDLVTLASGFGTTSEYVTHYFGNPAAGQQIHYNPSQGGETITVSTDGGASSTGAVEADMWVTDPTDGKLQAFTVIFGEDGTIIGVSRVRTISPRGVKMRSTNIRSIKMRG